MAYHRNLVSGQLPSPHSAQFLIPSIVTDLVDYIIIYIWYIKYNMYRIHPVDGSVTTRRGPSLFILLEQRDPWERRRLENIGEALDTTHSFSRAELWTHLRSAPSDVNDGAHGCRRTTLYTLPALSRAQSSAGFPAEWLCFLPNLFLGKGITENNRQLLQQISLFTSSSWRRRAFI